MIGWPASKFRQHNCANHLASLAAAGMESFTARIRKAGLARVQTKAGRIDLSI
jgi:hypothetical protein